MCVSNVTKETMVEFVIGSDDSIWPVRTGKNLVSFFQGLGFVMMYMRMDFLDYLLIPIPLRNNMCEAGYYG